MMDKKMTSGEIAKKAGVSQKAIRLYDEKGLLKPSEYSEGNYRLYDKEALLVLERIIALKHIGFSLEEIHENLIAEKNENIIDSLNNQLQIMEAKKQEIEKTISCIKSVLDRANGQPDWNSVAEITRMIQEDQGADERHFDALKHTADSTDWYVKIYNSLEIKTDSNILDLGCGFAKLWRNNWTDIPCGVKVTGVDLHGSWADNFAEFIKEHKSELSEGAEIDIQWSDIEDEITWSNMAKDKKYDYVVAHYLLSFLNDKETFIQRVASILKKNGLFSCNGYVVDCEHNFWKEHLDKMGLSSGYVTRVMDTEKEQEEAFRELLENYFSKVQIINLTNRMRYDSVEELFDRLRQAYPQNKKYIADNEGKIKGYFATLIEERGELVIDTDSAFWHCKK